jgi:multidrug efflux pump subunit AcrA (membrane-fusion protein)
MRLIASSRFLIPLWFAAGLAVQAAEIVTVEAVGGLGKVRLSGTVIPFKTVTLTAQTPGRIEFIAGEVGESFAAESVLVSQDDDDLLAKKRAAIAQLNNAQAALSNNYVQYNRELWSPQSNSINNSGGGMGMPFLFDQMFTRGFGNMMGYGNSGIERQADLHSQATLVNQAQSMVLQARSQIEELDAALRDTRSVAPFEGVVLEKLVEIGDTVQNGQPLLKFGHVKYLRIQVEAPARLVPQLAIGEVMPAYLDASRLKSEGRLSQIYPQADPNRHTVTLKFDLPQGAAAGPGMYAEVEIQDPMATQKPLAAIPKSAILKGGSLPGVLVVNEQNRSELRILRLGSAVDAERVKVLSGISPGERVIVDPPPGAKSGWMPSTHADAR